MNQSSLLPSNKQDRLFEILNSSIPFLIGVFLFFNPYPHITSIKEISFYGSVMILLTLISLKKTGFVLKTQLSLPFLLFLLWSFCGLFFALNRENSIHDFYAHLIKYLVLFYLLVNFFCSKERLLALVWTIISSTALFSMGLMIYFYLILGNDISTKLGHYIDQIPSNIIGISTLFAMLLSLYQLTREENRYRKIILVICMCTTAVATLATQTRGSIFAMFVSLILSFPKNRKILLFFSLFLAFVILIMPVKYRLTPDAIMGKIRVDDRTHIWYSYIEMVKDHPLTGIGFGMQTYFDENLLNKYNERVPSKYRQPVPHKAPHNMLVDIAVRTGLIGFVLFLYIIFEFLKMGWHLLRSGKDEFIRHWGLCFLVTFLAIFIQGQFENTMSGAPAIILYTILGMMAILWRLDGGPNTRNHDVPVH
jgi:putative inorganic carbon (HCO3(-)) transporter